MSVFSKKKMKDAISRKVVKHHTILIVDDEDNNLKALYALLNRHYNVLEADSGLKALELVRQIKDTQKIHLIISDQRMPGMTGVDFFAQVSQLLPDAIRILLTAFKDVSVILDSINRAHIYQYILKPYDRDNLLLTVRRALQHADDQARLEEHRRDLELMVEDRSSKLVTQARVSALGTMTAGMADQMRNPLNFINNFVRVTGEQNEEVRQLLKAHSNALGESVSEEVDELLETIGENLNMVMRHGERLNDIVSAMMKFSREGEEHKESTDVIHLLREAADWSYHRHHALSDTFKLDVACDFHENPCYLNVSPRSLSQAFIGICINAVEAMFQRWSETEHAFEPQLALSSALVDDMVELRFRDNGPGIPEEFQGRVFDHFFTTRPNQSGHVGLGLSLSYDIIRDHQGDISLSSQEGEYTEVIVRLPHASHS